VERSESRSPDEQRRLQAEAAAQMMRAEASEPAPAPQAAPASEPMLAQPVTSALPAEPAIEHAPAIERAPVVEAAPAPTPKPAPRPAPEPVHVDTRAMLEVAGLQMVETVRSGVPPVPPEEPQVQLGRPRRERPRPTEEPLKQVETKT
jgi:hypothetical protein